MTLSPPFDVHVVSHTHWDREWYHPAGVFRQRLVALVDELLDDDAREARPFLLDGQGVVLDDYLAVRPERREALAARLRAGVLEAGPWYVLADELTPGAEALVRNLLAGRRAVRALGAEPPPVLYSPDAFGHPAALPALAAGFGLELIVLWRGLGGERWPGGDTYRWRAPDGSEALVHHLPPDGYEYGSNLPADGEEARARWERMRGVLAPRARTGVLLVLNGADHHARQARHAEALEALARAALPDRAAPGTLAGFARAVLADARGRELPRIAGELRASYGHCWTLQGTFATRAHLKRRNARAERLLVREAEPWAELARRAGAPSQQPLLREAWRALLLCHPHDTLCGCSVDEVARAMAARLDEVDGEGRAIRERALHAIARHDAAAARTRPDEWGPVVLARNASARSRGGVAELEVALFRQTVPVGPGSGAPQAAPAAAEPFALDRGAVAYQLLDRATRFDRIESPRHYPRNDLVDVARVAAWLPPLDGYGTRALAVGVGAEGRAGGGHPRVEASGFAMRCDALRIEVADDGAVRLELAGQAHAIAALIGFEDVGDAGDTYTHSGVGPRITDAALVRRRLVHAGPLRGEIELAYRLGIPVASSRAGRSGELVPCDVVVSLVLDAGAPFLRVRVRGENPADDHRLRVVFRTGVRGAVHADAAFGPVRREPITVSPEAARVELPPATAPLHRYVTVADEKHGVTVFSDGLAEYEATPNGDIAVTLVRAVGELSRNDIPERPGHAGWPVPTPEAQCRAPFDGAFAVMPHGPRDDETIAAIERAADDVLLPLRGATLRSALERPGPTHGVTLEGEGLAFSACRESEDGGWTVLRCVNLLERAVTGRWRLGVPAREARASRLDETPGESLALDADGAIPIHVPARGVSTILAR